MASFRSCFLSITFREFNLSSTSLPNVLGWPIPRKSLSEAISSSSAMN